MNSPYRKNNLSILNKIDNLKEEIERLNKITKVKSWIDAFLRGSGLAITLSAAVAGMFLFTGSCLEDAEAQRERESAIAILNEANRTKTQAEETLERARDVARRKCTLDHAMELRLRGCQESGE